MTDPKSPSPAPPPTASTDLCSSTPAQGALTRASLSNPSLSNVSLANSSFSNHSLSVSSLSTKDTLDFALAHAQARDAVHAALSLPSLLEALHARNLEVITLRSAAADRPTYLRRPDLGRILSPHSATTLAARPQIPCDRTLTLIFADGLSALALDRHAIPLLDALLPLLTPAWHLTPIVIAEQARVAIADPIGLALHANLTLILIGERPGLTSPDSLGAYLTFAPRPGRTDAERNCVSNIRTQGLDYCAAATRIAALANEAYRLQLTGTALKDLPGIPATNNQRPGISER